MSVEKKGGKHRGKQELRIQIQSGPWTWLRIHNPDLGRAKLLPASVADPDSNLDPDPPDPHVFGTPGSGSNSQTFGSGSFNHHEK